MPREPFGSWVRARNDAGLYLCSGLDPDDSLIPPGVSLKSYLVDTIDAAAPNTGCFKPNAAFYEWRRRMEPEGLTGQEILAEIVAYIHQSYRDIPVICDCKRGDIGNTNIPYAKEFFDWIDVDAITVNGYVGGGALDPFFEREERGIIVMCITSNPEAEEIQKRPTQVDPPILGQSVVPLYQYVAYRGANAWNARGNCGLVVGATFPEEAEKVTQIAPVLFKLVPGIGDQGGKITEAVKGVFVSDGMAVYNISRALGGAWLRGPFKVDDPRDFAQAAGNSARHHNEALVKAYEELRRAA